MRVFGTGFGYGIRERYLDMVFGLGIRKWDSGTEYGRRIPMLGDTPMSAIGCGTLVRDSGTLFGNVIRNRSSDSGFENGIREQNTDVGFVCSGRDLCAQSGGGLWHVIRVRNSGTGFGYGVRIGDSEMGFGNRIRTWDSYALGKPMSAIGCETLVWDSGT